MADWPVASRYPRHGASVSFAPVLNRVIYANYTATTAFNCILEPRFTIDLNLLGKSRPEHTLSEIIVRFPLTTRS